MVNLKIKQFRLHSLGLMHVINYLSTSETVGFRKPHPKIFEDMIDQLGYYLSKLCMLAMMR